jgi:hypothetical protein
MSTEPDIVEQGGDQSRPPGLVLQARPVSGKAQEVRLALSGSGDGIGEMLDEMCGGPASTFDVLLCPQADTRVTGAGRTARLRMPVNAVGIRPRPGNVTLTGVRSNTNTLVLTAERLPITLAEANTTPLALVWRVGDCAAADEEGEAEDFFTIELTGRRDGGSQAPIGTAHLFPDLLVRVIRFVDSACS